MKHDKKTLLVVDGNSILNRAFYGIRPLTTRSGLHTNAVYGFLTILKKHLDALSPEYMACAFDLKAPTFRHKMYDGYKATRHPMPQELAEQLPYAKKAAKALGFHVIELEGWEADDILGTVAGMGDSDGDKHSYILTGDRDSLQLITDDTSVILVKTKEDVVYTPEKFTEDYGVPPERLVDIKALMGDSSDNIPGVPGIGEKTALKLIAAAGSLDGLYADPQMAGAGKSAKEKLASGKDSAYMSFDLAKISREAPIDCSAEDLASSGIDAPALASLCATLEFSALAKRFGVSGAIQSSGETSSPPAEPEAVEFPGKEEYASLIAAVAKGSAAFCISDGKLYCASTSLLCLLNPDCDAVRSMFDAPVICHDYKGLYSFMKKHGVQAKCSFDTMLAAYLLSPGESSYPVSKTVLRYLGESVTDSPAGAWYTIRLYPVLKDEIEKTGMTGLLMNIEIPLSPVLCDMEDNGFRLDCDGLRSYIGKLEDSRQVLEDRIYTQAGKKFNINSPKQLGEVLFDELGLPAQKKTKTGYSTDAETLKKLEPYNGIITDILEYREVTKLIGTYGENLIALADSEGWIHTKFNQTGTATGRLSSQDPNMQNIPVKGQLGRELRRYFLPADSEHVLVDADYSQIELRLLAEISGDPVMIESYKNGADIHASTAAKVFGIPPELVSKELRGKAKAVNFGIVYGIGDYSLSQDLHVSRKAAREYIDNYLATYVKVDEYLKKTVADAKENGYTTTMFGRRRPIPELSAKNRNLQAFGERVAMNSPIQGTAADIIKIAMINVANRLKESGLDARLILQVHDELIVEADRDCADKAAEILRYEMENAVKTTVPLSAEVSVGDNWLCAK